MLVVASAAACTAVVTADVDSYKAMVTILVLCQLKYSQANCVVVCISPRRSPCVTCVLLSQVSNRITLTHIFVADFYSKVLREYCQYFVRSHTELNNPHRGWLLRERK